MDEGPTAVAEGEATREADMAAMPGPTEPANMGVLVGPSPSVGSVCPFLISATGEWRLAAPTREHRCAALVPTTSLSLEKQARLCLTEEHTSCATYHASTAARALRGGDGEPVDRIGRWGFARTTPLIEDTGGLRGTLITMIGDRRTWPAIPAVLLVATLLAVGISGIRGEGPAVALASPSPAPQNTLAPELTPEPTPAVTPAVTPEPTIAPSPTTPTTPATPAASFQLYTVKSGDSLSLIASKFHTTVSAIATLNDIKSPYRLHVGQVLKIPPPS